METGAISDGQISASSEWAAYLGASSGRLHWQAQPSKQGSWSAAIYDANQWLQVDFVNQYTTVTGVATQGRNGGDQQWVKIYQLQYSNDGVNFQYYKEQGQTANKVVWNK